jgi:hypothetical protein
MKTLNGVRNINGAWPAARAVATTGLDATWVCDLFGFFQALMEESGQIPNASEETYLASQLLTAVRALGGNAGEIVAWGAPTVPAGVRLLPCDGAGVLAADYPALVANTYCGDLLNPTAPAFYLADDELGAVRNTAGIYFLLPNMAGAFARGSCGYSFMGGSYDSAGLRLPGAYQAESIRQHAHDKIMLRTTELKTAENAAAGADYHAFAVAGDSVSTGATGTGIGTGTANETRPDNVAVLWCIRY